MAEHSPLTATRHPTPYDGTFFDAVDKSALSSARAIVPLVQELMPFRSVVDFGCGRGAWLKVFHEHGADTFLGLDGDYVEQSKLLIPPNCFRVTDLTKPVEPPGRFDLAICLEVAEHLPRKAAAPLVESLCKCAPAVLFSAAIPGQGGTQHINEQWPEFWSDLFSRNGFDRLDPVRRFVIADRRVAPWYKQNTYIYVERSVIDASERLCEERDLASSLDVQIVANARLTTFRSTQALACECFRAAIRSLRRRIGV